MSGNKIEKIRSVDRITGLVKEGMQNVMIFPAKHFVMEEEGRLEAIESIRKELEETLPTLEPLEAQRLKQRTEYDLEMIEEMGYCSGIENYSRHFDKKKDEPP